MEKVYVIVEFADDGLSAYLEGIDGVVAFGKDLREIKSSMRESINMLLDVCEEYGYEIPEKLMGEYQLIFQIRG